MYGIIPVISNLESFWFFMYRIIPVISNLESFQLLQCFAKNKSDVILKSMS